MEKEIMYITIGTYSAGISLHSSSELESWSLLTIHRGLKCQPLGCRSFIHRWFLQIFLLIGWMLRSFKCV